MSSLSNVGDSNAYGNDDQKVQNQPQNPNPDFQQGKDNSHQANDPKDERSIANRLANETQQTESETPKTEEDRARKIDPTLPAKMHGNEPSWGAKIDKEIEEEEAEILAKKQAKGPEGPAASH